MTEKTQTLPLSESGTCWKLPLAPHLEQARRLRSRKSAPQLPHLLADEVRLRLQFQDWQDRTWSGFGGLCLIFGHRILSRDLLSVVSARLTLKAARRLASLAHAEVSHRGDRAVNQKCADAPR